MKHRQGRFKGAGEVDTYYQYWQPESASRGLILVVHGAGEHSGRYQRFAQYFADQGYVVAALDHAGHGQSGGAPMIIGKFDDYLETLAVFQRQLHTDFPQLPLILLGHSMGGLVASNYLLQQQQQIAGCVLSGPAIMTDLEPGWLQTALIRFLSKFAPAVGVLQLDANGVSRDPEEVARYLQDPLVFNGKMPARFVAELFAGMQQIQQRASEITLPMLILHGSEDAMASPQGSRFLHDAVSSADKTLKIYPGLYHEIFNEPEHEAVFADVLTWCDRQLASRPD